MMHKGLILPCKEYWHSCKTRLKNLMLRF